MTPVEFKDLCLDATDPAVVGRFWAAVVGGALTVMADGDAVVRGGPLKALWINGVAEPKTVKNRVHLDVWADDVAPLLDLGATVLAEHERWRVLGDPEGNELCVFAPPADAPAPAGPAPARVFALCVDSADPVAAAEWWQARLGGELGPGPDGARRYVHGAAGLGPLTLKFVPVADVRTVKNRCHWDVVGDPDELVAAGASMVRARDAEISWTVLADPDGNEFCTFSPR